MITFVKLEPGEDGETLKQSKMRVLPRSAISSCPFTIFSPEHYREDNSCKCNDCDDPNMKAWGYRWSKKLGRWTA